MSLILLTNSKDRMFFGYTSSKWWKSVLRGVLLSLGMWLFYLGLGIGAYLTTLIWLNSFFYISQIQFKIIFFSCIKYIIIINNLKALLYNINYRYFINT